MRHPIHQHRTLSLFDARAPKEKGSREWASFSAVHDDQLGAYRVVKPKKPIVIKGPRNFLRIINPPPTRAFRPFHTLRGAH